MILTDNNLTLQKGVDDCDTPSPAKSATNNASQCDLYMGIPYVIEVTLEGIPCTPYRSGIGRPHLGAPKVRASKDLAAFRMPASERTGRHTRLSY